MMKKIFTTFFLAFWIAFSLPSFDVHAAGYGALSKEEKTRICDRLEKTKQKHNFQTDGLGGGAIPDEILESIYATTKNISDSVFLVSILGDTLMCHAVHAAKQRVKILGVELFSYPNVPIWLAGGTIYLFGFMLLLSITFYVVDISFKLGFAIILLPIGVALWPFGAKIKDLDILAKLVSIFLKSAGIFAFLAVTVSFTVGMVSESLRGLVDVFEAITTNNTDYISERFTFSASEFLLVVAALVYGMKLIGSTIPDYVDRFFPDKAFGSQSPMHAMATQAMDFAKKKAVQPAMAFAHDVAKTQAGKVTQGAGNLLQGKYHKQIMTAVRNPGAAAAKVGLAVADKAATFAGGVTKTANNLRFGAGIAAASLIGGKANRENARNKLRNMRDAQNTKIDDGLHGKIHEAQDKVNESIEKREKDNVQRKQQKLAQKQQKHQRRMATSPLYRAVYQKKEQWTQKRQNRRQNRLAKIGAITDKIDKINEEKEGNQTTANMYEAMDNVADKVKVFTKMYRGVKNFQKKLNKNIDAGKYAADVTDTKMQEIKKKAIRGVGKLAVHAVALVPKIPLAVAAGAENVVVNTVNTGAKLLAGSVVGGFINTKYNVQKIVPTIQRTWYQVPETLREVKNIWKAPGVVLERVGQAMQQNKKKKKK